MKIHIIVCISILFFYSIFLVASESDETDKKNPRNPFEHNAFVIPSELKGDIDNYRTQWSRLTGFEYSGLHWGQFIIVYSNIGESIYAHNYISFLNRYFEEEEDDDDTEAEGSFQSYEIGTIFIKENFISSKGHPSAPISMTIMIKHKPGYDSKHGDWEYIQSDIKGNVLLRGKHDDPIIKVQCAECHSNVSDRDYIFSTFYSKKQH